MRKIVCLFLVLLFQHTAFSQYQKMLDVLDDVEKEETGSLTLRFFDADNGTVVPDASINISDIGHYKTTLSGVIQLDKLHDGMYNFTFSKDGYISAAYTFEVVAGSIFMNRYSVCPKISLNRIRIVLDWGASPSDLDLTLIKTDAYQISYRNKTKAEDGSAWLDRDDKDGWGPETISILQVDNNAHYTCLVKDYSNRNSKTPFQLSDSRGIVRVYNKDALIKEYYAPKGQQGNQWILFEIQNGKIIDLNKLITTK